MRPSRILREQREGILSSCVKLTINSPDAVEIAGLVGFSAVWLCLEHGPGGWNEIAHMVRAGKIHDLDVIVRVSKGAYSDYVKAFECDAAAIMVPHVTSAREAAAVVDMCRFQPRGHRALDGGNVDGSYCMTRVMEYLADGNQEKFIILQVESPEGLDAVEEIAEVEGYDFLMLGPGDFGHRIGNVPGEPSSEVEAARERVETAARKFGKKGFGVGVQGTPQEIKDRGYGIVNLSSDVRGLANSWSAALDGFGLGSVRAGY